MQYKKLRQEFARMSFRKKMKEKLGSKCANCSSIENIEYHHIVPLKNGGTNKLSNIVPLCVECHCKAHDKKAIQGREGGRPAKSTYEEAKPHLKRYFNKEIGKKELSELLGYKRVKSVGESSIFKRYKEEYDIPKDFYNNIDLLKSQIKRIDATKNENKKRADI